MAARAYRTEAELHKDYILKAKSYNQSLLNTLPSKNPTCSDLGSFYGVGIGLYFKLLKWLSWSLFFLFVASVPYLIAINLSVFTDEPPINGRSKGARSFSRFEIYSLTFAAILDSRIDNGTLHYMNSYVGRTWYGPMKKNAFFLWISIVDAVAIAIFTVVVLWLSARARRFLAKLDRKTTEVSDYTILVRNLPHDATPVEIGTYFRMFGTIVDVCLVDDVRTVLDQCARVSKLEQQMTLTKDQLGLYNSAVYEQRLEKVESELLAEVLVLREKTFQQRVRRPRAAFVTFNTENERQACLDLFPKSWFFSLLMGKMIRFRAKHHFFVTAAAPPNDYIYENMTLGRWTVMFRRLVSRFVVLAVVIVCATFIILLTNGANSEARSIYWYDERLARDLSIVSLPQNLTNSSTVDLCKTLLPSVCTDKLVEAAEVGGLQMEYGAVIRYPSVLLKLINEYFVLRILRSLRGADIAPLDKCLPCHCLGLRTERLLTPYLKNTCRAYVNSFNIKSWVIRIGIAAVVALINMVLNVLLKYLVLFEGHESHSELEKTYALLCFGGQLLNSVAVLVLVNATFINKVTDGNRQITDRLGSLSLSGTFSDFSPEWYKSVGLSFMILMIINCFGPVILALTDKALKIMERCRLLCCRRDVGQDKYHLAWAKPQFTLERRAANILLGMTIALVFGSGVPLLYLFAAVLLWMHFLIDKIVLVKHSQGTLRHSKQIPYLIIDVLPYLAFVHCLFGIWMHTYFVALKTSNFVMNPYNSWAKNFPLRLRNSYVWRRITLPNGLSFLILAAILFLWMVAGRFVVSKILRPLSRWLFCGICYRRSLRLMMNHVDESLGLTYEEAINKRPRQLLGVPTYRLSHNPVYAHFFMGEVCRQIYIEASTAQQYTRLVPLKDNPNDFRLTRRVKLPKGTSALQLAQIHMEEGSPRVHRAPVRGPAADPGSSSVRDSQYFSNAGGRAKPHLDSALEGSPARLDHEHRTREKDRWRIGSAEDIIFEITVEDAAEDEAGAEGSGREAWKEEASDSRAVQQHDGPSAVPSREAEVQRTKDDRPSGPMPPTKKVKNPGELETGSAHENKARR